MEFLFFVIMPLRVKVSDIMYVLFIFYEMNGRVLKCMTIMRLVEIGLFFLSGYCYTKWC